MRKCSGCIHKDRQSIENARANGQPLSLISAKFGINISTLRRHLELHARHLLPEVVPESPLPDLEPPSEDEEETEEDAAAQVSVEEAQTMLRTYRAMAKRLEARLNVAVIPKDVAMLSGTLLRVNQSIARLTGEGEITEAMVIRSAAFGRIMAVWEEALRPFPEAAKAVAEALAPYVSNTAGSAKE